MVPCPRLEAVTVVLGIPGPKRGVYLRLYPDVLDWFKESGKGYQTRINKVHAGVRREPQAPRRHEGPP